MWLIVIIVLIVAVCYNKKISKKTDDASSTLPQTGKNETLPLENKSTNEPKTLDADALMALSEHYFEDKDNEKSTDLALEYLERAAEAGHPKAIMQKAYASYKLADIRFSMVNTMGLDGLADLATNAHKWSLKLVHLLQSTDGQDKDKKIAHDRYMDSIVWLSSVYLLEKNYDGILRITKEVPFPVAQAYYGRALYEFAETQSELDSAFYFLKNFMHTSLWVDKYNANEVVHIARVEPCVLLATLYRTYYKDVDSAYNVFSILLQYAKGLEERASALEDISHFHQTPSGHYEYIE